jgi:hypothetical protein
MGKGDLVVGHGSSRPLSPAEQEQLSRLQMMEAKHKFAKEKEKEDEKYKGYLFWCSEGCGFVDRNHRCEQWSNITYVPPELVVAIKKLKKTNLPKT